jgi:hypothetical protein
MRIYLENRTALLGAFAWLIIASTALAQSDAEFSRANDEFSKGRFQDAIKGYQTLVDSKQWSAPLFYNLGNAYFRTGDFGRAILNYERALALDPRHPETAANIALAREETRSAELQNGRIDILLNRVTTNQVVIAATITFWLMVFAVTLMISSRRRSTLVLTTAVMAFLVTIASVAAVYRIETTRGTVAIVTADNVRARLATADNAGSVMQLPPGSEVQILSHRGDWVYAGLPNKMRGWIPAVSVESVRL